MGNYLLYAIAMLLLGKTSTKKQLQKIKKVGMKYKKNIQTRVVRMETKVNCRPYLFLYTVPVQFLLLVN